MNMEEIELGRVIEVFINSISKYIINEILKLKKQ